MSTFLIPTQAEIDSTLTPKLPRNVYGLVILTAVNAPSKNTGNEMLTFESEIVSPETVKAVTEIKVAGVKLKHRVMFTEKSLPRAIKFFQMFGVPVPEVNGMFDTSAIVPAAFIGKGFKAILQSKESKKQVEEFDPSTGQMTPVDYIDPDTGKPVISWQPDVVEMIKADPSLDRPVG